MNEKQKKSLDALGRYGKVVKVSEIRKVLYVDLLVTYANGKKQFDVYRIRKDGKSILIG
jgi:hypothetical protein